MCSSDFYSFYSSLAQLNILAPYHRWPKRLVLLISMASSRPLFSNIHALGYKGLGNRVWLARA